MPLIKSGSKKAVSTNIREMMASGYPQKQAVAAALDTARRYGKKYAEGGSAEEDLPVLNKGEERFKQLPRSDRIEDRRFAPTEGDLVDQANLAAADRLMMGAIGRGYKSSGAKDLIKQIKRAKDSNERPKYGRKYAAGGSPEEGESWSPEDEAISPEVTTAYKGRPGFEESVLEAMGRKTAPVSPTGPYQPEIRNLPPETHRQRWGRWISGSDTGNYPGRQHMAKALTGTTGIGSNEMGLVDVTPLGMATSMQEAHTPAEFGMAIAGPTLGPMAKGALRGAASGVAKAVDGNPPVIQYLLDHGYTQEAIDKMYIAEKFQAAKNLGYKPPHKIAGDPHATSEPKVGSQDWFFGEIASVLKGKEPTPELKSSLEQQFADFVKANVKGKGDNDEVAKAIEKGLSDPKHTPEGWERIIKQEQEAKSLKHGDELPDISKTNELKEAKEYLLQRGYTREDLDKLNASDILITAEGNGWDGAWVRSLEKPYEREYGLTDWADREFTLKPHELAKSINDDLVDGINPKKIANSLVNIVHDGDLKAVLAAKGMLPENAQRDLHAALNSMNRDANSEDSWAIGLILGDNLKSKSGVQRAWDDIISGAQGTGKDAPLDVSQFEKFMAQKGSNPGGVYRDPDTNTKWYLKTPKTQDHADNEILAARLYELAGVPVPHIQPTMLNHAPSVASKIIEGPILGKMGYGLNVKNAIAKDMPIDAWLANWDAIGMGKDNIIIEKGTGIPWRIDMGGSLRYRAQGGPKGDKFGNEVGELKTFTDKYLNPDAYDIFGGVDRSIMKDSVERLKKINNDDIVKLVDQWGPRDILEREKLYNTLAARKEAVINAFADTAGPVKAMDPSGKVKIVQFEKAPSPVKGGPAYHPQLNENGMQVEIKNPTKPSYVHTWSDPTETAVFAPGNKLDGGINGIAFESWKPKLLPNGTWMEQVPYIHQPEFTKVPGKNMGAGVVMLEPDGRVWLTKPTNEFGGYKATFPKGTVEANQSFEASAMREAFEETGLKVKLDKFIGDFERTTSKARYFLGGREGGSPADMGWETQGLMLVPISDAKKYLNNAVDHKILDAVQALIKPKTGLKTTIPIKGTKTEFPFTPKTFNNDPKLYAKSIAEFAADGAPQAISALKAMGSLPQKFKKDVNSALWALTKGAGPGYKNVIENLYASKVAAKAKAAGLSTDEYLHSVHGTKPPSKGAHKKTEYTDEEIEQYYKDTIPAQEAHEELIKTGGYDDVMAPHLASGKHADVWKALQQSSKPITDWINWKPTEKHEISPLVYNLSPERKAALRKLGFNPNFTIYKGGWSMNPSSSWDKKFSGYIDDPMKSLSSEYAWFGGDRAKVAKGYIKGAHSEPDEYFGRVNKGLEVDWLKYSNSYSYSHKSMQKLINAARAEGYDFIAVHNIADVGSSKQTQYLFLEHRGTLRAPHAKFDPAKLHPTHPEAAHVLAGVAGGGLFVYGTLKGREKEDEMKKGGRTPMAAGGFNPMKWVPRPPHLGQGPNTMGMKPAGMSHVGAIRSTVPGRTDKLPMNVKGGSYVIPASVVSGMAQGNTLAGFQALDKMFGQGPYGMKMRPPSTPRVNFGKMSAMPRMPRMAQEGGDMDGGEEVPIIAAGGEYIVSPEAVRKIGGGDIKHGHEILDQLVMQIRKQTIHDMRREKPPKK